jgi:hypothetical protein
MVIITGQVLVRVERHLAIEIQNRPQSRKPISIMAAIANLSDRFMPPPGGLCAQPGAKLKVKLHHGPNA